MLKVTNERRWRRTKWVFTLFLYLLLMWAIGGLEDSPINSVPLTLILLPSVLFMTMHLTKDWDRDSRLEEWWYRNGRE